MSSELSPKSERVRFEAEGMIRTAGGGSITVSSVMGDVLLTVEYSQTSTRVDLRISPAEAAYVAGALTVLSGVKVG